ncbi:MAG TPA: ABC transporter ATP-binding protein, partial [Lachnospiraceae bacterium]|nr:ABC transporter ATP-binding protein [Lachnospiraceae bacterium]
GCRFAARCPYATQECKFYQVPVKEFGEGRMYRCLKGIDELKEAYSHE